MSVTVQLPNQKPTNVNGRLEAIIRKLLLAADDIIAMRSGQITIDVGPQAGEVKVTVPKAY